MSIPTSKGAWFCILDLHWLVPAQHCLLCFPNYSVCWELELPHHKQQKAVATDLSPNEQSPLEKATQLSLRMLSFFLINWCPYPGVQKSICYCYRSRETDADISHTTDTTSSEPFFQQSRTSHVQTTFCPPHWVHSGSELCATPELFILSICYFFTEVTLFHLFWILNTVILKHQPSSSKQTFCDPGPGPAAGNRITQSPIFHSHFLFFSCISAIQGCSSSSLHPCVPTSLTHAISSSSTALLHFPENLAFVEIRLKVSSIKFHLVEERSPAPPGLHLLLCICKTVSSISSLKFPSYNILLASHWPGIQPGWDTTCPASSSASTFPPTLICLPPQVL